MGAASAGEKGSSKGLLAENASWCVNKVEEMSRGVKIFNMFIKFIHVKNNKFLQKCKIGLNSIRIQQSQFCYFLNLFQ